MDLLDRYRARMRFRATAFAVFLCSFSSAAVADVIQLKDKATVTGKIVAEKRDSVFVDIGYTVLPIPRAQVAKISRDKEPEIESRGKAPAPSKPQPPSASNASSFSELFQTPRNLPPERTVRELVAQLGSPWFNRPRAALARDFS
jgi:hypothetical protein